MGLLKKVAWGCGGLAGVLVVGVAGLVAWGVASFPSKTMFADTPYPTVTVSADPAVIERGRYLVYGPAHCGQCHGIGDREHPELAVMDDPLIGGLEFAMGPIGTTFAPNLTSDSETGIARLTDAEIARTVRSGVRSDGRLALMMKFSAANPSDEDLGAIISYLRSVPPVKHEVPGETWGVMGKVLFSMVGFQPDSPVGPVGVQAGPEPSLERGEYLADHAALCTVCHTAMDPMSGAIVGEKAGGSLPDPSHGADSDKEFVAPNLTSHATGITGQWDEDRFVARFAHGRVHISSIMPWENFKNMTDGDMRSIYRYLKSLPPVDNDPGPTYRDVGWVPAAG